MPCSRTHDIITLATAAAGVGAYWQVAAAPDWSLAALFTIPYLFAGFACAGDLDLKSTEYRRWGPFRCLWFPYQKLVPHRSWVSHGLIMGGLIRVLYLLGILSLIAAGGFWCFGTLRSTELAQDAARYQWSSLKAFVAAHPTQVGVALAGFILAGTMHTLADVTTTWFKRRF